MSMRPLRNQEFQSGELIREWWIDEDTGQEIDPPADPDAL